MARFKSRCRSTVPSPSLLTADRLVNSGSTASRTISSSIIVGNSGSFAAVSNLQLLSTIVANNIVGNASQGSSQSGDISSSTSLGHNLIGNSAIQPFLPTDISNVDPQRYPLALYAPGTTATYALKTYVGSSNPIQKRPAIANGSCSGVTVDQRGVKRSQCDIGAFETRLVAGFSSPLPNNSTIARVMENIYFRYTFGLDRCPEKQVK